MAQMPSATGGTGSMPPDYVGTGEPPGWPKGLGIFSIVWASLGILCNGCGTIYFTFAPSLYQMGRDAQMKGGRPDTGPFPDVLKVTLLEYGAAAIAIVGVILLLIAGIALVRRTAAGRSVHIAYGIVSIVGTLVWGAASMIKLNQASAYIASHPDDPFFKQPGATIGLNPIVPIAIGLIALAYPVFILIWFLVIKKRSDDMGTRSEELEV